MGNRKILILGAKGMLGQELSRVFSDNEVTAWDFADLDITNETAVREKVAASKPEIIINAAAYNNVDRAEEEKDKADLLNGHAVGFLACAAKTIGAVFVHYSTDYVFDGERREGYAEDAVPGPISIYGASKFLGETRTRQVEKFYLIRLSRLFGRTGSGDSVKKSFVDVVLDLAGKKDKIDVINEETSLPTYAPDAAERTKYILENNLPYGIYHAANGGACTWHEFAQEIFRQAGKNVIVNPVSSDKFPRPARRPKHSVLLNTKLPPMRPWREALSDYLKELLPNVISAPKS